MTKGRMEAFSDGVIAIIITIMALELKVPQTAELAGLLERIPIFFSYALSFLYVGIYWNNHHHLLQAAREVNGRILWANQHLLFWLSLIPFATGWMGATDFAPAPSALYGCVMLLAAIAYTLLTLALVRHHGPDSAVASASGRDFKGILSMALYAIAIPVCYVHTGLACGLYFIVAVLWLIPDSRVERAMASHE